MSKTYDVIYDKTFTFDLTGKTVFGDLSESLINKLFKDGRVASSFIEQQICVWFPDLTFVGETGYDHVDKSGRPFDLKGFTTNGAKFQPSSMIGAGRSVDIDALTEHANSIDYVFSDITEFPIVRIVFKRGSELIQEFPNGNIKPRYRKYLFG
jgi:hypothetical protein